MFKLMIVDDEFHIRDGIANAIPWNQIGVEVIGTCANVTEAIELMNEQWPDIIITDINLGQGMDGLDLVEMICAQLPKTRIIILSGYDKFEYAKKALELKVHSYLLKPVLPNEWIDLVQKIMIELQEEQEKLERLELMELELEANKAVAVNRIVDQLIEGSIIEDKLFQKKVHFLGLHLQAPYYCAVIMTIDSLLESINSKGEGYVQELVKQLMQSLQIELGPHYDIIIGEGRNYDLRIIIGMKQKKVHSDIINYLRKVQQSCNQKLSVTASIGGCYSSPDKIGISYSEALTALDYKMITGKNSIVRIEDVNKVRGRRFVYPFEEETALLHSFDQEEEQTTRCIDAFFENLELKKCMNGDFRMSMIELFSSVSKRLKELGVDWELMYEKKQLNPFYILERMDTFEEIKQWFTDILQGALAHYRKAPSNKVKSSIQKAKDYMNSHYADPSLSLQAIAEIVFLNPSYFSKLYKQETGETYVDYITSVRIGKAKKLLRETNIKMNDVGIAVGYPNPTYFSSKFKKQTGLTPLEYRESVIND